MKSAAVNYVNSSFCVTVCSLAGEEVAMAANVVVTAAEIARLAGVGRAAVSNWRRRHEDFPRPAGGTETSPTFRLEDVELWLRDQGKLRDAAGFDRLWQQLEAWRGDLRITDLMVAVGAFLRDPEQRQADIPTSLLEVVAKLAEQEGAEQAFEQLYERFVSASVRQLSVTPPELARLLVDLAAPVNGTVLDPACGTGSLLLAGLRAGLRPLGQELDGSLARLASVRLSFHTADADIRVGGSLRADAFGDVVADVVLCNPPFNERDWGHDELAYDQRWEYGLPPRGESELAWLGHCLSRVKPSGTIVMVMPPAVASRRSGRRIRAELVRRGALRAVIGLPAGAAQPFGVPLSVWVLRRPTHDYTADEVLFVDTAGSGLDWDVIREQALNPAAGASRKVPAIDLLDEEVDLSPARHVRTSARFDGISHVSRTRGRLLAMLTEASGLVPEIEPADHHRAPQAMTSIGDLAKAGALSVDQVHMHKTALLGLVPGDVVVSVVDRRIVPQVVTDPSVVLMPQRYLLRPNPDLLDPWFLMGFLRSSGEHSPTTTHRLDLRRVELPRVPLQEQRRYGAAFRGLHELDRALRATAELGDEFLQAMTAGLAAGALIRTGDFSPTAARETATREDCTAGDK
jgi:N-6 DNA Methylase